MHARLVAAARLRGVTLTPAGARAEAPAPNGCSFGLVLGDLVVPDTGAFYDVDFAIGARYRV